jgi:hypothetical protein
MEEINVSLQDFYRLFSQSWLQYPISLIIKTPANFL